jgi:hypothetical protein
MDITSINSANKHFGEVFKMIKIPGVLRLVLIVTLSHLTALPPAMLANHSWGNYHWARQSNPFTVALGDNVDSNWDTYLNVASGDWSISTVLNTTVVAGGTAPRRCRPTSGRVEVCNATYGNNGWLGIAQIWASGTHITQGVVKLNDTYFNLQTYNTPAWRQFVTCQEIGHTFGLDHQDENFNNANLGTCMDYTNNPSTNMHPNQHDYGQLVTIYSHLDTTTTVGGSAVTQGQSPAMNDIELDGPRQWGRKIKESGEGRQEVYEFDFGNGHKVFTFVTWAPGHERGRGL